MSDGGDSNFIATGAPTLDDTHEVEVGVAYVEGGGHVVSFREFDSDEVEQEGSVFTFGSDAELKEFRDRFVALIDAHLTRQPQGTC